MVADAKERAKGEVAGGGVGHPNVADEGILCRLVGTYKGKMASTVAIRRESARIVPPASFRT